MSGLKLCLLFSIFIGCNELYSVNGIQVKANETFVDRVSRAKILNTILTNPANLMSETKGLDDEITKRKKEINKMIKALGPGISNVSLEQKLAKLRNILRHQPFYVHETYIVADILYKILKDNPNLIKLILSSNSEVAEEDTNFTKLDLVKAFNDIALWKQDSMADPFLNIDFKDYEKLKENYNDKPIFKIIHNIRECIACDLSRKEVPLIRKYFEDQVVEAITKSYPNKQEQIVIADFATGNLFQTFINVNKIAAQGYTNIRLNLIDLEYKSIIQKYRDELIGHGSNINVINIKPGPFKITRKDLDILAKRNNPLLQFTKIELSKIIEDIIEPSIINTVFNNTFAYFSMWFNNTPVNLEIVIYGDAAEYLEDCKTDSSLKSDLLTAVDYFTETYDIFEDLRINALKPQAKVLGLIHDQEELSNGKYASRFYFSRGSKDEPLQHFKINLKTGALTPISDLPHTTEDHLQGVRELFQNLERKINKTKVKISNLRELTMSLYGLAGSAISRP